MTIDYHNLKNWHFDDFTQTYTKNDSILYALGIGFGSDPTDRHHLRYLLEDGLLAFPTMAVVIGLKPGWLASAGTGVNYLRVLHAEQALRIHRPLPAEGRVISRTRVTEVVDKGAAKGAIVFTERTLHAEQHDEILATVTTASFCRANGGFGGPVTKGPDPHPLPSSPAQFSVDIPTSRRAALIYRLSGDFNLVHGDPDVARAAGFSEPILHGLCTYAIAGRAIIEAACGHDAGRLISLAVRFSAPVYPGETLRTEMWRDGDVISFRTTVPGRDNVVVLNNGRAEIRA